MFTNTKKSFVQSSWHLQIILLLILLTACENPITGLGPRPSYIDKHKHKPMLNVFGVLRPDVRNGMPMSYVHLEQAWAYSYFPDTTRVTDASVKLFEYEGSTIVNTIALSYTNFDSAFPTSEYRHPDFYPIAGHTYGISCFKQGYPELTSRTTVPSVPKIVDDAIQVNPNNISFSIMRDSLAALYDVYLIIGQQAYADRIQQPEAGDIAVKLAIEAASESAGLLIIYAYDLQLSEYITYNVIIKTNSYRSDYSTVDNGFGCFGSLNIFSKMITL